MPNSARHFLAMAAAQARQAFAPVDIPVLKVNRKSGFYPQKWLKAGA